MKNSELIEAKTPIEKCFRINEAQKKTLLALGITDAQSLLRYFPRRYADISEIKPIKDLETGDIVSIYGEVEKMKIHKTFRKKITMSECVLKDHTGSIRVLWFNQPYLAKMFEHVTKVKISGTVMNGKHGLYLANPSLAQTKDLPIDSGDSLFKKNNGEQDVITPIYRESKRLTSLYFEHKIRKLLHARVHESIPDPIPESIRQTFNLPSLKAALSFIHAPRTKEEAEGARKRFAFEEVFLIQIARAIDRKSYESHLAYTIPKDEKLIEEFSKRFSFPLTKAQKRSIEEAFTDIASGIPMSRLLEGDVGSGKTAVAAIIAYHVAKTNPKGQGFGYIQTAYMAPTEILAKQHFESFIKLFHGLNLPIALITGKTSLKFPSKINNEEYTQVSKKTITKWLQNGEIAIAIGTHALIEKEVQFKNLGLVIIDEQHRFGLNQRQKLAQKGKDKIDNYPLPHLLSMTATPIPRTLSLTLYGDLNLSILDEMPKGRLPIKTEVIFPHNRDSMYKKITEEIKKGRQAYIICPRIDEPDETKENALLARSVKAEAKRLQELVFPDYKIGILHGKMTPKEKDEVMGQMINHEIDILVATSVVEVGVNIPNATVIIIEGAERFGLAQLHQLRGRVMRSTHQPYCFLYSESESEITAKRLKALMEAKNGFELAEMDFANRGAGELTGAKQWGISDLGMEAIKNTLLVKAARGAAQKLADEDPSLSKYPIIKEMISQKKIDHFE